MATATDGSGGSPTVGGRVLGGAAVRSAVEALVEQVRQASAEITEARGPSDGSAADYEAALHAAGETKGRKLLYPYLGSGLGNGALVELADGSVKWDMITGIGVHFFGHSHPELVRASLMGSLENTAKHGNLASNRTAFDFGRKMVELAGRNSNLKYCFPTTSGAMANENAVKVCYQKHSPADRVLAFAHCFMGRSTTMAQIGDSAGGRQGLPVWVPVDYMPFWDEAAAERMGHTRFIDMAVQHLRWAIDRYPKRHACFIFELVQGEGGFNTAPREFFTALMDVCRDAGIAIWDDEIQTFGRTGRMFAYETYDLGEYVDVFCVGKMTQVCCTMYTERYNPKPGLLSGTFTGATQDFAVGLRILELLDELPLYEGANGKPGLIEQHHRAFRGQAEALRAKHPEWFPAVDGVIDTIGGIGGMMKLTPFGGEMAKIGKACRACFEEGVIVFYCGHGPHHVRMLPPLGTMKLEDWPRVFACLEKGFAKAAS